MTEADGFHLPWSSDAPAASWQLRQMSETQASLDVLRGLVIIVTGASSGIGEATARGLHAVGAHPVLAARRHDRLVQLSDELDGALTVDCDVTRAGDVDGLLSATLERHGRLDGLVNNAGASLHRSWDDDDLTKLRDARELNLVAYVSVLQAALPALRRGGGGRVVNVGSGTTRILPAGAGPYAATKAAVDAMSLTARKEFAPEGIAVSLVSPSVTATEFCGGAYQSARGTGGRTSQSPEYVAEVILKVLRTGEQSVWIRPDDQPSASAPAGTGDGIGLAADDSFRL